MNEVILVGRLIDEPRMDRRGRCTIRIEVPDRETNGSSCCNLSVHCHGGLAEKVSEVAHTGSKLFLRGNVHERDFRHPHDENKKELIIVARFIDFLTITRELEEQYGYI